MREGLYVYLELIHAVLQQKLTGHGRTVILQLKHIKNRCWHRRRRRQEY